MPTFRFTLILSKIVWHFLPLWLGLTATLVIAKTPLEAAILGGLWAFVGCMIHHFADQFMAYFGGPDTYGTAALASRNQVAAKGLISGAFNDKGLMLGRLDGDMIRYAGDGHLITFAPTRSGKGVGCVIPNLLEFKGSAIVVDIKGENYKISAGYRRQIGRVVAFAPFDPSIPSARFNPLDFVRRHTPFELDDARLIAEMLIDTPGHEPNHWDREARTLLTGLILHAIVDRPEQYATLGHVRALLMQTREKFDEVLEAMTASRNLSVARIAAGFQQKEPKERSYVVSTAQARTDLFDSDRLSAMTSSSTFQLAELVEKPTTLYLVIPPEMLGVYKPFLRLMTGLALATVTRQGRSKTPILAMLDEMPALGYMRPIEEGIGYLAGYNVKLWMFVQDLEQLEKTYPKARSMIANCAVRQAFNVQDPVTAKMLSDMLGTKTVRARSSGSTSPLPISMFGTSFSAGQSDGARPLMTPDEIMTMSQDDQLIFVQGLRGIRATKLRFYSWRELRLRQRADRLAA